MSYDDFKLIVKEKISNVVLIVDFVYSSEDFFNSVPSLLLTFLEIDSKGYIGLFPIEEGNPNELGSSDAQ